MEIYKNMFPDGQFYFELTAQPYNSIANLRRLDAAILTLSGKLGIPCVVDNSFHYVSPSDKDAFDIATCIKDGKQYYEHGRQKKEGDRHIMAEDEIIGVLTKNGYDQAQISQRMENNQKLIESIDIEIPLHQLLFPVYESPDEIKQLYETFQKTA